MKKITLLLIILTFPLIGLSQEVGTNDIRISNVGTDGDGDTDGDRANVAYNSTTGNFLVVWEGDPVDGEQEYMGSLLMLQLVQK